MQADTSYPIGTVLYFYHEKLNQVVKITVQNELGADITEEKWNPDKYGYVIRLKDLPNMIFASTPDECLKNVWNQGVKAFTDRHARLVSKTVETYPQIAMVQ